METTDQPLPSETTSQILSPVGPMSRGTNIQINPSFLIENNDASLNKINNKTASLNFNLHWV
jgi:hypothetical protein